MALKKPFVTQIRNIFFRKEIKMNLIIKQSDKQVLDLKVLKEHLRIDHNHEDTYLKEIILMATDILEKNIDKPILKKTYCYTFYGNDLIPTRCIPIPVSHVINVLSVQRIINDKDKENVSYSVKNERGKTLVITNGTKFPIEITYTAGMTDKEKEIPKDLQFAVLQIAKNIYECSEEDVLESKYIKHIINSNRTLHIN